MKIEESIPIRGGVVPVCLYGKSNGFLGYCSMRRGIDVGKVSLAGAYLPRYTKYPGKIIQLRINKEKINLFFFFLAIKGPGNSSCMRTPKPPFLLRQSGLGPWELQQHNSNAARRNVEQIIVNHVFSDAIRK